MLLALGLAALAPTQAHADPAASPAATSDSAEVVVNGIPYRETVLPTRLKSSSVYGLDLNVMDTPRNTTLLSTTQLETVNIQDPRAFSYLTASSFSDSSFGTPNIPRIRGQYADVFYNGMRDSFTQNGYGAPINFDALENLSITKGPASVIDGPGAGVGGEVDFLTKRPSLYHFKASGSASVDSVGNRRVTVDVGGPINSGTLAAMFSYSGEDSGSYFYGHYMHKNALYGALTWAPNDKYRLEINSEINVEQYTEEVGVNRVNQQLIDHGTYLQNDPAGVPNAVQGFLTFFDLGNSVQLNPKITIDQTPGTSSRAKLFNAQAIQTWQFNNNLSLENNTFFAFQDSDNQEGYYYADESNNSYTFENRLDLKGDYDLPWSLGGAPMHNQFVVGGTFRFAHTYYISNFNAEAVSAWDLTQNPAGWVLDPAQQPFANAVPYTSVFGRQQYGVLGRDAVGLGNTGVSDLYDTGLFFQDRIEFTPQLSALFGGRIDALQDHTRDPLGCDPGGFGSFTCEDYLPAQHTTGVYGLGNVNFSVVYKFTPMISGYATFDWTQSTNPNGGEGGVNAYGQSTTSGAVVTDSSLMRGNSYLYEAGLKFNLLNNKLFASTAVFDQKHGIATGPGGTQIDEANIRGVEIEMNYQPTRNLFATASYSYIKTTLNQPVGFYDFPAQVGLNVDGAGTFAVFKPGQTFQDPGQPEHVFNFLGNYKFENGFGLRTGVQVTGPIPVTTSGYLDLAASTGGFLPVPTSGVNPTTGYYSSPVIPWQYTWNAAAFYEFKHYTVTVSVYNLTDRRNWQPAPAFYGNDFLVLSDPRTYELRIQAKF